MLPNSVGNRRIPINNSPIAQIRSAVALRFFRLDPPTFAPDDSRDQTEDYRENRKRVEARRNFGNNIIQGGTDLFLDEKSA